MMENKNCTTCTYEYTCNWEPAGDRLCCEHWRGEVTVPEPIAFSKQTVINIISQTSGCDGRDEYARGWDAACDVMLDGVRRLEIIALKKGGAGQNLSPAGMSMKKFI